MILSFEQFKTKIVNPSVFINKRNIIVNAEEMTISVDVTLIDSSGSSFCISLEDIKVDTLTFDPQKLEALISKELEKYVEK